MLHKSPGADQIQAELIQTGGEKLHSEIYKLIKLIWNKEELPHQWSQLSYLFKKKVIKLTVAIMKAYHYFQIPTKFYPNILLSRLIPHAGDIIGDHQCGF
jgi:hypothetical protein